MSFSQRKHQFQVQIRKKNLHSRLTSLRSALYKQTSSEEKQQILIEKAKVLVSDLNENNLLSNITKIKAFSYDFTENMIGLFVQVINKLCEIVATIDDIKQYQNQVQRDNAYNDILVIFINASCQESYNWPKQQYLPIIKSLLIQSRQINTLWFLSNLLYLRNQTSQSLCRQLIKYDSISFCKNRLKKKMKTQNDIIVLSFYICSFLTNSNFLLLNQYKEVILILESLIAINSQQIDWLIAESLVDHGPNLKNCNYQILYSKVIQKFGEYCKMKNSKIVMKYLQFLTLYLKSQIKQLVQQENNSNQQTSNKIQIKKQYRKNYERFSTTSLLYVTYCMSIRSPSVKCSLLELCHIVVENYFQFIDFQSQIVFLTLTGELNELMSSPLSKFNSKTIFYQLKYTSILLIRIIERKGQNQQHFSSILQQFMKQNKILVILTQIIKQKEEPQIINQACTLLYYLIQSFKFLKADVQQCIVQQLILALEASLAKVKNEDLFNKIDCLLKSIKQIQI